MAARLDINLSSPDLSPPIGLIAEEHLEIRTLHTMVYSLRYFVEAWEASLALFQFAKSKPPNVPRQTAWRWQWIAIHECVMQLSFLEEALRVIRSERLRRCPAVLAKLDTARARRAASLLSDYFPNLDKIRNAIAHQGANSMSMEKHAPHGEYGLTKIGDDGRFETVFEGSRYHLYITEESLCRLAEVVTTFWSAFEPVEKAFDLAGRAE